MNKSKTINKNKTLSYPEGQGTLFQEYQLVDQNSNLSESSPISWVSWSWRETSPCSTFYLMYKLFVMTENLQTSPVKYYSEIKYEGSKIWLIVVTRNIFRVTITQTLNTRHQITFMIITISFADQINCKLSQGLDCVEYQNT